MQNQERMLKFLSRMEALSLRQAPLGRSDLTLAQFALLACIARIPGSRAIEVAETMGLTAPTVSVALRRLEEGDWLRREADPEDKRAARLYVTDKAADILMEMKNHRNQKISQFMNALSIEEQGQLLSLLEKATETLE
jgi:DNA-binding MarR family transcriptional regulator